MATVTPVIMCGGSGSRLWPLSRRSLPKQFLKLIDDKTLLEATASRASAAPSSLHLAPPVLFCGPAEAELAREQVEQAGYPASVVVVEPVAKNTAAVAASAALHAVEQDPDAIVLLLPADHHMEAPEVFWESVETGLRAAKDGSIVTFGIEPRRPETGYGYIKSGAPLGSGALKVAAFKEKPSAETAEAYLASGGYYWNSGIFLFRADAMIREFEALGADLLANCAAALQQAERTEHEIRLDPEAFNRCRSEPLDLEIMERTDQAAVVAPVRAGWDDIGSWGAVADIVDQERDGVKSTHGEVLRLSCEGGMVRTTGPQVVAIGLKDIVVVATPDAVLITHKDCDQEVKTVFKHLKQNGRDDLL